MKLPDRRQFLHLATGTVALSAVSRIARAQAYPTRPVRIVVGVPAGGSFDTVARMVGQWLSERLGQLFVIENRAGAATNIATELVARAPADGYTLLLAGSPAAINATLYDKLPFNLKTNIAPVASMYRLPLLMAVNPALLRVHQSCQGQSRQDQHGLRRHRRDRSYRRRVVQDDGGRPHGATARGHRGRAAERPAGRAVACRILVRL